MTGLFLIGVVALWVMAIKWLVHKLGNFLPARPWRRFVEIGVLAVLIPLPLIDEITAIPKFKALCQEKEKITVDTKNTIGRQVWFDKRTSIVVSIGLLKADLNRADYVDTKNGELIYHYYTVNPRGGFLIHLLKISEGNTPLLIE